MPAPLTVQEPAELLSFILAGWPEVKRTKLKALLKHQSILVNGRATSQFNHVLRRGDVVSVQNAQHARPKVVLPQGMKVYFEDEHLIVIDKPADLLTIASEGEKQKTAYFYLTDYVKKGDEESKDRIWIVHRLDRETSGLMVFAKTIEVKRALQEHWDEGEKKYEAVVDGVLKQDEGTFDSHLDETNPYRVRSAPPSEATRHAITHYKVIKRAPGRALVGLTLQTGRRHQIRVHLADAGCPIIGDEKYQARSNPARRLGLHACSLKFKHPVTGEEMKFESPLPKDLAKIVV